ncbi:hypothetical protein EDB92DRAFT_1816994 [Lactarius akahatsu]|uniref:Uncharacterized protein n=1 Tax=Lactarius akahatsu TaxID=416441 RepID=A0AAD4LHP0_9AGAM|nr:hypothetical protein EDB92DRAFT_1816994 [Lactarius akahatsu]
MSPSLSSEISPRIRPCFSFVPVTLALSDEPSPSPSSVPSPLVPVSSPGSSSARTFSPRIPHSPAASHVTSPFTSRSSSPAVLSSPVARVYSLPASHPRSPTVPLGFALPDERPHSSPVLSPSLVEDDLALIEGVKTSKSSVFDCQPPQKDTRDDEEDGTRFAPRQLIPQEQDARHPKLVTPQSPQRRSHTRPSKNRDRRVTPVSDTSLSDEGERTSFLQHIKAWHAQVTTVQASRLAHPDPQNYAFDHDYENMHRRLKQNSRTN